MGDALDVGEAGEDGLAAGRSQALVFEGGYQVVFLSNPDRGVGRGDGGVAATGGLAGPDQWGLASLVIGQAALAFGGLWLLQAVVEGAQAQVGELVAQQGLCGALVGVVGLRSAVGSEGVKDVVESVVQAAGADRHGLAASAVVQECGELSGGCPLELIVELFGPGGVRLSVAVGGAVGQGPAGGVAPSRPAPAAA